MREHEHLSYAELIDELQALAARGCTGVMFMRTESDHSVRIGLQNGRVVSCNYRMYQQQKAISLIRQIRSGEYAFKQGVPGLIFGEELPANFDFFRELTGESSQSSLIARQDSSPGATDLRISGGELFEAVVQELTT